MVAGPYHPAFGQLVEDSIWYDKIVKEIKKINANVVRVEIQTNTKNINNVVGHKKENLEKLKDTYAVIATAKRKQQHKTRKI